MDTRRPIGVRSGLFNADDHERRAVGTLMYRTADQRTMSERAQCTHTFPVPDYEEYEPLRSQKRARWMLSDDEPGVTDGVWTCPHEVVPGTDRCLFHLPPGERPADSDVTGAFLDCLREAAELTDRRARRRKIQFVDADLTTLDLRGEVVGGDLNYHIDLAHATIGGCDWTETRFAQPLRCSHATFTDELVCRDATFEGILRMQAATFEEWAQFRGATFRGPVVFKEGTFEQGAQFWYPNFEDQANFRRATFADDVSFEAADFTGWAGFSGVRFEGEAEFRVASFDDDAAFDGARFAGNHSFTEVEFGRTTDFSDVVVEGEVDLSGATVRDLRIQPEEIGGTEQLVSLRQSTVEAGELGQPPAGRILYDATEATLGAVRFTHPEGDPVTDRVRLVGTAFDGFEFENDSMNPQTDRWRIDSVADDSLLPPERRDPVPTEKLVQTYLNAKNGATQTGNNTAASEFFYLEMTFRRRQHRELLSAPDRALTDRILDASRWVRNGILSLTTGYGERPDRVIYVSVATVLGFAFGYAQLLPGGENSLLELVVFSFQSFITFLLGPPPAETTVVQTVSAVQGFLGAFFVALFVFTFTRRIHR